MRLARPSSMKRTVFERAEPPVWRMMQFKSLRCKRAAFAVMQIERQQMSRMQCKGERRSNEAESMSNWEGENA